MHITCTAGPTVKTRNKYIVYSEREIALGWTPKHLATDDRLSCASNVFTMSTRSASDRLRLFDDITMPN